MPTPTPPPPPPKNPGRATEDGDEAKENTDPQQVFILLPVLYGLFSFAIDNGTITGNDRNRLDVSNCSHVAVVKLGWDLGLQSANFLSYPSPLCTIIGFSSHGCITPRGWPSGIRQSLEFDRSNYLSLWGEDNDKRDQSVENATTNKKADSDSEEEENVNEQKEKGISNKKKKLQRRMKIAELKQIFSRPDVVEVGIFSVVYVVLNFYVGCYCIRSKLLVFLKSYQNTVPVSRHWCQKRKFLQGSGCGNHQAWTCRCLAMSILDSIFIYFSVRLHANMGLWFLLGKRGIEKPPFQLPDFIAATGIEKIRQVFHDVFFNYQTKPKLTSLGDLYHEGKEFERASPGAAVKLCLGDLLVMGSNPETASLHMQGIAYVAGAIREICLLEYQVNLREMKPGMLSHELKEALGIPEGAPPPWLINMQVLYGPPSSYPHLKIPGLNAPIPPGASFGYHPGGWGKPPVDEYGSPLYGDVFGVHQQDQPNYEEEPVDKTKHWGDLEEEEEVEDESEEMEEEELEAGIQSVDSLSSTPTGVETPDVIDLRKLQRKEPEKPLYQEEKIAPGTLLGTTHTLIYLEVKSQIKWMSLYCQKSWMPRKMFYPQSMKKQGRKGSYEISVRISVTWWQRMRRGRRERCKKRRASPRGIRNLSSKGGFMPFSFVEKNGGHGSYPFIKLSFSTKGGLVVSFVVWHFYHTLLSASSFHCFLLGTYYS
ncbi:Splicing factor 3B subunit 2 [Glycine soja]